MDILDRGWMFNAARRDFLVVVVNDLDHYLAVSGGNNAAVDGANYGDPFGAKRRSGYYEWQSTRVKGDFYSA